MCIELYILDVSADCGSWDGPVTDDGKPLYSFDEGNRAAQADRVRVRLYAKRVRHLPDLIWAGSDVLLMSHHVYEIVQRFEIDDDVGFLAAEVCTKDDKPVGQYLLAHSWSVPLYAHDILDYDRAKYKHYDVIKEQLVIQKITHWVADPAKVPPFDLFCTGPCMTWVVTGALKDALETHGVTGCQFLPIEISPQ